MQILKIQKNKKYSRAFSLVEMLVAIGIFMSIMTVAVSSLISIMGSTKKAQAIKSTVDSVTFALENISRDMRIGTDYDCLPLSPSRDCTTGSNVVQYVNSSGESIEYRFSTTTENGLVVSELIRSNITKLVGGSITTCNTNCSVDLISKDSNVHIDNMVFYIIGSDHEFDNPIDTKTQPRGIITASGFISVKGSPNTTFNLQTNVSQRVRR